MGNHTNIHWCDSTVNPTTGCDGCELWKLLGTKADLLRVMGGSCYAGNFHEQRLSKSLPALYAADFTEVRMAPGRMAKAAAWSDLTGKDRQDKPWLNGLPRTIFVGDMGDILSGAVSFEYLRSELIIPAQSWKGRRHIWMVLTKRPGRLAEFARWLWDNDWTEWPKNIWVGTSITGKASLGRIDDLVAVPAAYRFLSVEPLIEPVDLSPWLYGEAYGSTAGKRGGPGGQTVTAGPAPISLVIVGGESGPHARPFNLQWARDIRDQCEAAGVAFFMKQLGAKPRENVKGPEFGLPSGLMSNKYQWAMKLKDSHGGDWDEWPADLRVREFPRSEVGVVD